MPNMKNTWELTTFAEIDSWRNRNNLTRVEACRLMEISTATYQTWRQEQATPSPERQRKIKELIDKDVGLPKTPAPAPKPEVKDYRGHAALVTAEIVSGYLAGRRKIKAEELPGLVRGVRRALGRAWG